MLPPIQLSVKASGGSIARDARRWAWDNPFRQRNTRSTGELIELIEELIRSCDTIYGQPGRLSRVDPVDSRLELIQSP
jgi:hypothetical protein